MEGWRAAFSIVCDAEQITGETFPNLHQSKVQAAVVETLKSVSPVHQQLNTQMPDGWGAAGPGLHEVPFRGPSRQPRGNGKAARDEEVFHA